MDELKDHIITIQEINCEVCKNVTDTLFNVNKNEATESFYKKGWRIIDGKVYCPDCWRKHMNNKVSQWHKLGDGRTIYDYLGISEEEYENFLVN
jgi:hypothetical protein